MKKLASSIISKKSKGKTIVEYLPDADEIERSPVPRFAQFTIHILLLSLVVFSVWASVSQLDQVVVAQGRLVNPLPNVVVQPIETSVIKSVDVRVGQVVKVGQTLATLDSTVAQADESQLQTRLSSLETQMQGIEQELSGGSPQLEQIKGDDKELQANLLAERMGNYRAQQLKMSETAGRLRASLATNRQDQQRVAARLKSLREIEVMQEKMVAQKFGAPIQLLEAQQRTKEVERDLELVQSRELEIRRELAAFDAEKSAFEKGWRQKLMEEMLTISRERDSLKEQLQKAERRNRLVTLTAPVDAVVLEIAKLSPGSIVKEAETFFTLVPLNATLEIEAQVDAVDVGYLRIGQSAHVKLDAYPYQKHGMLNAKVRTISEDAFRRDAMSKNPADSYYVMRMQLDSTQLLNMADTARLLPGMTLSAEIVVGQRSIISYLAWPLTKGITESIREP